MPNNIIALRSRLWLCYSLCRWYEKNLSKKNTKSNWIEKGSFQKGEYTKKNNTAMANGCVARHAIDKPLMGFNLCIPPDSHSVANAPFHPFYLQKSCIVTCGLVKPRIRKCNRVAIKSSQLIRCGCNKRNGLQDETIICWPRCCWNWFVLYIWFNCMGQLRR